MINIDDLDSLKITKVKDWAIYFDYDNRHYLLHGSSELGEGSWQDLYERYLDSNGHYELRHIKSIMYLSEYCAHDYILRQKGKTIVYKNIDKEYFVYKLTKRGFATGLMEDKVKEQNKHIDKINKEIEKHEKIIAKLRSEINQYI